MEKKLIDFILIISVLIVIILLIIVIIKINKIGIEVINNPLIYGIKQTEKDYGITNLQCFCYSPELREKYMFVDNKEIKLDTRLNYNYG